MWSRFDWPLRWEALCFARRREANRSSRSCVDIEMRFVLFLSTLALAACSTVAQDGIAPPTPPDAGAPDYSARATAPEQPAQNAIGLQEPHPWAVSLAKAIRSFVPKPIEQAVGSPADADALARAIGAPEIRSFTFGDADEWEEIGPGGISKLDWTHLDSAIAGGEAQAIKYTTGVDAMAAIRARAFGRPLTLQDWAVLAPRLAVVRVKSHRRVYRGDGLINELELAVEESWRGSGETMLLRLPEISDTTKAAAYLPPAGTRLFFAGTRTGYLARTLIEGRPPSIDERVVHALLPPIPIVDGVLRVPAGMRGFPGLPPLDGTSLSAARSTLDQLGRRIEAALSRTPSRRTETVAVVSIDGQPRKSPLWLWFKIDPSAPPEKRVFAGYDGCNWFFRIEHPGGLATTERDCFDAATGAELTVPGYKETILGKQPPKFIGLDQPDRYAPITVVGNGHRLEVRRHLR